MLQDGFEQGRDEVFARYYEEVPVDLMPSFVYGNPNNPNNPNNPYNPDNPRAWSESVYKRVFYVWAW